MNRDTWPRMGFFAVCITIHLDTKYSIENRYPVCIYTWFEMKPNAHAKVRWKVAAAAPSCSRQMRVLYTSNRT